MTPFRSPRFPTGCPRIAGCLMSAAILLLTAASPENARAAAHPYRGLWVGQVNLHYVTEVSVPLDESNVPVAPDPEVPTPTSDQAHLRLILHVDGAGRVSLLKDVAILTRGGESGNDTMPVDLKKDPQVLKYRGTPVDRESDLALVTDERLYGEFPPQPAMRIASAVFDFGDASATMAVREVIDAVAAAAVSSLLSGNDESAAAEAGAAAAIPVVENADVSRAFAQFLTTNLNRAAVNILAGPEGPAAAKAAQLLADAQALQARSFFGDSRGIAMVQAIVAAAEAGGTNGMARTNLTQNTAAAFADLERRHDRFLAGRDLGDMIRGAAEAAATAAAGGATADGVRTAVLGNAAVRNAKAVALQLDSLSAYADTRSRDAVDVVLTALLDAAVAGLPVEPGDEADFQSAVAEAADAALADSVARHATSAGGPTPDYDAFITSALFRESPVAAASAAASAARIRRAEDPLISEAELVGVARDAAIDALRRFPTDVFGAAARTTRHEIPMQGVFGPGEGDPRFRHQIKVQQLPPLGAPALTGSVFLPASHPTNPFRHRRHPDHSVGFDITRELRLDFDPPSPNGPDRPGYGLDRISGIYREEIRGLHKPLGPQRNLGFRVEGRFQLTRISLVDALNAP